MNRGPVCCAYPISASGSAVDYLAVDESFVPTNVASLPCFLVQQDSKFHSRCICRAADRDATAAFRLGPNTITHVSSALGPFLH